MTTDYTTARLAVGFVDLVGFTSLAQELTPAGLSGLLDDFEDRSFETVAEHGGQLVKHIGDEMMFVVLEAEAACDIALSLVDAFRAERVAEMCIPKFTLEYAPLLFLDPAAPL